MASKSFHMFAKDTQATSKAMAHFITSQAPVLIGTEAVNHFKTSFLNQGFTDAALVPWKPAKRTNASSVWYGFEAGAKTPKPNDHPSRWKAKKAYKPRKQNPVTNFSPAATSRPTLTGSSTLLAQGITFRTTKGKVIVYSDHPAAKVQNEGGTIKVFGNKSVTLPKRQFMGNSIKLHAKSKLIFNKGMAKAKLQ